MYCAAPTLTIQNGTRYLLFSLARSLRSFVVPALSSSFPLSLIPRSLSCTPLSSAHRTLDEFLSFLRRDGRSEDEFAHALRKAGTLGKEEYMRAMGGVTSSPAERHAEQKRSDR